MSKLITFPRLRDFKTGKLIAVKAPDNYPTEQLNQIKNKAIEQANKLKKLFNHG